MDSDSFYPAFITAARVVGLGSYAVKLLEASGIILKQEKEGEAAQSITWVENKEVRERIKSLIERVRFKPTLVENVYNTLLLEAVTKAGVKAQIKLKANTRLNEEGVEEKEQSVNETKILVTAEAFTVELLNGKGESGFMQIGRNHSLAEGIGLMSWGTSSINWPASSTISESKTVKHNLGVVPKVVVASSYFAPSPAGVAAYNTFGFTNESFAVNGYAPTTAGGFTSNFGWIALG